MWDYYLAYCEAAFRERHISDVQLMLTKNANPAMLHGEPWGGTDRLEPLASPQFVQRHVEEGERVGV